MLFGCLIRSLVVVVAVVGVQLPFASQIRFLFYYYLFSAVPSLLDTIDTKATAQRRNEHSANCHSISLSEVRRRAQCIRASPWMGVRVRMFVRCSHRIHLANRRFCAATVRYREAECRVSGKRAKPFFHLMIVF